MTEPERILEDIDVVQLKAASGDEDAINDLANLVQDNLGMIVEHFRRCVAYDLAQHVIVTKNGEFRRVPLAAPMPAFEMCQPPDEAMEEFIEWGGAQPNE